MEIDMKKYAKVASFGALAMVFALAGLYAFMAWGSSPTPLGGIDQTQALIAYIGIACPLGAIAAAHLVFYRVLSNYAKEHGSR